MAFQMLLCGECYENVYTLRRTNYPSFNIIQTLYKEIRNYSYWELSLYYLVLFIVSQFHLHVVQ
jgi:hypothetical protein